MDNVLPASFLRQLRVSSLKDRVNKLKATGLKDIIRNSSDVKFISNATKHCYRLEYQKLFFTHDKSRDNFTDGIVAEHKGDYAHTPMHSLSGEGKDICLYTYSPMDLVSFLDANKHLKYTFLPITVHPIESANGYRHDMLLIFDNKNKLAYWFDGRNRDDYLQLSSVNYKSIIDTLFVYIFSTVNLGYSYETWDSWAIPAVFAPFPTLGEYDFVLSTAWCTMTILILDNYDTPMGFASALDSISREDLAQILFKLSESLLSSNIDRTIPTTVQKSLIDEKQMLVEPTASSMIEVDFKLATPEEAPLVQEIRHRKPNNVVADTHASVALTSTNPYPNITKDNSQKKQKKGGCVIM